jgi:ATP:cob(I)alamin adenosyltransferase
MYWTLELASKLEDAPWPATKEELIDYATRSGAPMEVIENLKEIDEMNETLIPFNRFLLPQGSRAIAQAHICRTICRKLERKIAHLSLQNESLIILLQITNRLSDYFFILARLLHKKNNIDEKYLKMR